MYFARVERDSITVKPLRPLDRPKRVTSFVVCAPRVLLAELVTPRTNSNNGENEIFYSENTTDKNISKNSASSRAIPFSRMLEYVEKKPYVPRWTANQKGMQGEYITDTNKIKELDALWDKAKDYMVGIAGDLCLKGAHKQDCNRLLEPFSWTTQILTSTNWDNFFALRCHEAAYPPFRKLARMMYLVRLKSTPILLKHGQWHLPFVPLEKQMAFKWRPLVSGGNRHQPPDLLKHSAARCAWVSYDNHAKDGTVEAMLKTYAMLTKELPIHASPVEHQCTPFPRSIKSKIKNRFRSNLDGWLQARKLITSENIRNFDPPELDYKNWEEYKDFVSEFVNQLDEF